MVQVFASKDLYINKLIFVFMNIIYIILVILFIALAFFFAMRFLKSIFKAATSVLLLVMFIGVLFTGVIVYDLNSFRKSLNDNVSFIIVDQDEIITSIDLTRSNDDEDFSISDGFNDTNVSSNKLEIIVELDYLIKNQSVNILDFGIELSEEDLIRIYRAENVGDIHLILVEAGELSSFESSVLLSSLVLEFSDHNTFKKAITTNLIIRRFRSDYNNIVRDIRDDKIQAEPEFISIKAINSMPDFMAKWFISD